VPGRRRPHLRPAAGLVAVGVLIVLWWWTRPPARPPNILLITIDTLRADRVGAYGAGRVATPWLDGLAREGVRFAAAYATAPLTLPSHVSMLSGLLPAAHMVRTNDGSRVPDGVPLAAELLRDAGYDTGAVVGSYVVRGTTGLQRGFVHYDDDIGPGGERRGDAVAERAQAWLEGARGEPWFLWVHFFDPHLAYDPPEPYRSSYRGRLYDGEVAYTDAQVGTIVGELDQRGLLERTAILVAGDHGEGLGDHGEQSHGALLYDPMISVPLLLRLPEARDGGRVVSAPVSLVEIAPTILELAGLPSRPGPAGLLAQLRSPAPRPAPPISETLYLTALLGWSPIYSFRAGRHKVIDAPAAELYDMEADPSETENLADTQTQRARDLVAILRGELAAATRSAPAPSPADEPQVRERLAALGYVQAGVPALPADAVVGKPSAMDRIELWMVIEEALALAHGGDHAKAQRLFERVLREDEENALALKFLGARMLELGDFAAAVSLNQRLEATGLHATDALSNLALAYDHLGRPGDALDAADRALAAAPDHVAARFNRAVVLSGMGRTPEALQELGVVLERDPEHAGAQSLRARLAADGGVRAKVDRLLAAGDLAGAARALETALADQPEAAALHDELGRLRARLGDLPGARAAFERALALNAQAIEVRERLAAVLHQSGDRSGARRQFEQVLAQAPDRRAPRISLGILELEEGRPERAVAWLEPVTQGWDGAPQALLYLGHARMALLDRAGARRAYEACIEMAPRGAPVAAEARRFLESLR